MKRSSVLSFIVLICAIVLTSASASRGLACTASDFGSVVDQTAQALRDLNRDGAQRFQAKLRALREKHGLSEDEIQARAAALQDDKLDEFNREIDTLFGQMDTLSQTPNDKINCEKLDDLKRVRDRLLTLMGQKSGYMLAKADTELDRPRDAAPPAKPQPAAAPQNAPAIAVTRPDKAGKEDKLAVSQPAPAPAPAPVIEHQPPAEPLAEPTPNAAADKLAAKPEKPPLNPGVPERRPSHSQTAQSSAQGWAPDSQTMTPPPAATNYTPGPTAANGEPPISLAPPPAGQHGEYPLPPPGAPPPLDNTFSIAEIQEAGRGVFGTVTAQFAAAINYAFQQFGRPNAYIKGNDGGAAFLAGLRYGSGELNRKGFPPSKIFWQGPSLGYDLGAEGSSALFLVYNLDDPEKIYGRFTGIGGSAYVAGGLGLNVLGKSGMVMVPIRTGVGLRIGANLAYLKFTERQTWNPF